MDVGIGDVIMLSRQLVDKQTKKPYTWRFLAVVVKVKKRTATLIRLDNEADMTVDIFDHRWEVRTLDECAWPDGARVIRMKLIMEGRLDGLI